MMLRNMVTSLLDHEKIQTTLAKAKEVKRLADKVIVLARKGDLHSRRQASAVLTDKGVLKKLFSEIGPRFQDRSGGFTRVFRLDSRLGDAAPLSVVMLTEGTAPGSRTEEKKKARKAPSKKKKTPSAKAKEKKEKEEMKVEKTVDNGESSPTRTAPKRKATRKKVSSKKGMKGNTDSSE